MNTEIYIENYRLDVSADISSLLNFAIDDIKDFASRSTTWSKTIVLPGTANNNKLFGHIFQIGQANDYNSQLDNVGYNYNASKAADCIIFQDQMQTFKGVLRLMQINIIKGQIEYEVAVFGELAGLNVALSSGFLEDLDFSEYDHSYNASGITSSWANTSGTSYYYPLIDYGTYSPLKQHWDIRTFRPALHVREYIDKMMTAAGFRWSSDLFDTARFKSLIIPHNQKTLTKFGNTLVLATGVNKGAFIHSDTGAPGTDEYVVSYDTFSGTGFTLGASTIIEYTDAPTKDVNVLADITNGSVDIASINVTVKISIVHERLGVRTIFGTQQLTETPASFQLGASPVTIETGDFLYLLVYADAGYELPLEYTTTIDAVSFTVNSPGATVVNVNPGDTVVINDTIPKNIRQIDFLSGIIKLFNLYVYEDRLDRRLIHFTPYIDFYSQNVYPSIIGVNNYANNVLAATFTNITLGSTNYIAGRLYLFFITTTKATTPEIPTMTGTGQTWTRINTIATATKRLTVFRFYCTVNNTNDTTVTIGPSQTSYITNRYEITGMETTGTNGADAIVQSVTNSATGADPSIALGGISNDKNAVIAVFSNDRNPFAGTPESGWTENFDGGNSLPSGGYAMHRKTTTDNTPTVTAASSDWIGIALEIKSQDAETIDWTYKLNRNKALKIKPMSELNAKEYEFKYKPDNDFYNEAYRKRYSQGYGDYVFDSDFEFAEQKKSFEILFSATPLVGYSGEDKVFPTIFKKSNDVEENIDSNIRIMQSKKITGVTSWDIKDDVTVLASTTDYGYAGHFDDPDAPANDLNFGALRELFFTLATGDLTTTQFNVYWSAYMAEITDKDSKLLTAYFYLTAKDILLLDFSKKIFIDGVLFRLNAIKDYNTSQPTDCEAELLKIQYLIY